MLKNRKVWLIIIGAMFLVSLQSAFAWWNSNWQYRQKLTLDTTQLSNDVTDDLPIMVKVDSTNTAFWNHVDSTGKDVRFVASDDTTELKYHFEKFDYSGQEMIAWVKVTDTFTSASDIDIYMYYGNSSATDAQDESGTYTADFSAVYHMDDASGGITDSTSNNHDGTEAGDPTYQQTGKIGNAISFDGTGDYFSCGDFADLLAGDDITVLAWVKFNTTSDYSGIVSKRISADYPAWDLSSGASYQPRTFGKTGAGEAWNANATTAGSTGVWYQVGFVRNTTADTVYLYINGASDGSSADNTVGDLSNADQITIGKTLDAELNGLIDEVKILHGKALSADAIKLLYLSESNQLITFGSEETSGPTTNLTATINSPNGGEVISASSTTIDFNVEVSGVSNPEVHVKLAYSTTQGAFENIIETDLNLNDYADISNLTCDDANFEDSTNCQYTWDLFNPDVVPDGNYYIDINAWEVSDGTSGTDSSDGKFEIDNAPEFSTDFSYTQPDPLDPENGVTEVTSTFTADLTYKNVTPSSYTYTVDGNTIATTDTTDYNFTTYGDFNVCLFVVYDYDYNADTYEDGACKTIHVKEYPQGLDFTPTDANVTQAKDFTASVSGSQPTIEQWYWFFPNPDTNYLGQTATHTFNATGTMQVCVTAQNTDDLNRTKCKDVTVYGALIVHFYDEQTNAVVNASVNFLDNNYNTTGIFTYYLQDFAETSSTYTLTAWDVNRHERHLILDLNKWSYYDINMLLLDSDVGRNVLFQFFAPDESTLLSNATVRVKLNNAYVDATVLNSDAKGTLFLDTNNAGYSFHITTPDGNQYVYNAVIVIVKIPKQEDDLAVDIMPFEVDVGGLAKASYTNQTTDLNFYVLGNTYEYYRLKIGDWNADDYYDRYYYVRIQGAATTYTIQPYLVSTETGLLSAIYGINSMGSPLGRVMFVIQKQLNDIEPRTVQTVVTDDTGKGLVSWVVNDTYYVKVYYNNQYVGQVQIMPSSSTYYITVTTETTGISGIEAQLVYVQFSPSIGRLALNDLNQFHFDVNVYSPTSSITSVTVTASCKGNTVYSETKSTNVAENAIFSVDINKDDVSSCKMLEVTVSISTPEGTITKKMTYGLSNTAIWLWGSGAFSTIKNLLGDWVAMLIALLITIMAVGAVAFKLNPNPIALGIVAGAIMGFFTYVGWIPLPVFVFACLGAGAVAMLTFRWQVSG